MDQRGCLDDYAIAGESSGELSEEEHYQLVDSGQHTARREYFAGIKRRHHVRDAPYRADCVFAAIFQKQRHNPVFFWSMDKLDSHHPDYIHRVGCYL